VLSHIVALLSPSYIVSRGYNVGKLSHFLKICICMVTTDIYTLETLHNPWSRVLSNYLHLIGLSEPRLCLKYSWSTTVITDLGHPYDF
jgi:hypothetical protein